MIGYNLFSIEDDDGTQRDYTACTGLASELKKKGFSWKRLLKGQYKYYDERAKRPSSSFLSYSLILKFENCGDVIEEDLPLSGFFLK